MQYIRTRYPQLTIDLLYRKRIQRFLDCLMTRSDAGDEGSLNFSLQKDKENRSVVVQAPMHVIHDIRKSVIN